MVWRNPNSEDSLSLVVELRIARDHQYNTESKTLNDILLVAPTSILVPLTAGCYRRFPCWKELLCTSVQVLPVAPFRRCSYRIATSLANKVDTSADYKCSLSILVDMDRVSSQG